MYFRYLLLLAVTSVFSSAAIANSEGIEVVGKAAIKAVPDSFSITLRIKQRGAVASKAKNIVDNKSQLLMNALNNIGFDNKAIDSSNIVMYPVYEKPSIVIDKTIARNRTSNNQRIDTHLQTPNVSTNASNSTVLSYFDVTRSFVVSFDELAKYDQLLDVATKIGVSHISSLTLAYKNSDAIYQQALKKALQNAKNKAQSIATQMDVELAGLTSLRESGYHAPQAYAMMSEAKGSFRSNVSEKEVVAQVIAKFAIQTK